MLGGLGNYASLVLASLFASSVTVWFELRQRLQMAELRAVEYFRMSVGRGLLTTLLVSAAAFAWRSASLSLFALAVSNFLAGLLVPERHLVIQPTSFRPKNIRLSPPVRSSAIGQRRTRHCFDVTRQMAVAGVVRPRGSRPVQRRCFGNPGADPGSGGRHRAPWPIHWPYERWSLIPKRRNAQLAQNFIILIGIVLPSAAGVVALSDNLAHLIVAEFYWKSVVSLAPWLSAAAVVATIRAFYIDTAFQLANRTLLLAIFTSLALVVNLALNIWLIPSLGVLGAAIASFFALLSSSVVAAIYSRFVFPLPLPIIDTAKVLASTGVMFLLIRQLALWPGPWALLLQVIVGCAVYTSLVIILNVLNVRGWIVQRFALLRRGAPPYGGQPQPPV